MPHISSNNFIVTILQNAIMVTFFISPQECIVNNNRCYRENIRILNQSISELASVQIQHDLCLCLFWSGPVKSQMTHKIFK